MPATHLANFYWEDGQGRQRRTTIALSNNDLTAVLPALEGASHSRIIQYGAGDVVYIGAPPTVDVRYDDVGYMGVIDYSDALNEHARLYVPAPSYNVLLANVEDFYTGSAPWLSLAADMIAEELLVPNAAAPAANLNWGIVVRNGQAVRSMLGAAFRPGGYVVRCMEWVDEHGNDAYTELYAGSAPDNMTSDLRAMSNAGLRRYYDIIALQPTTAITPGDYHPLALVARLEFRDAVGNKGSISIPSPYIDMFFADRETLNPAALRLGAIEAALSVNGVVESSGLPIDEFTSGRLVKATARLGI